MKTRGVVSVIMTVVVIIMGMAVHVMAQQNTGAPDRTVLPIQEPKRPLYTELDARNAKMPPRFEVKAPAGAPNVVIILIDDLGFGATEAFGGPIPTPTLERLAQERTALQQLPYHGTVLADARSAQVRPQPPHREHGLHHRDGDRFPGRNGPDSQRNGTGGRNAAAERLQHRGVRQMARDRCLGDQRLRSL